MSPLYELAVRPDCSGGPSWDGVLLFRLDNVVSLVDYIRGGERVCFIHIGKCSYVLTDPDDSAALRKALKAHFALGAPLPEIESVREDVKTLEAQVLRLKRVAVGLCNPGADLPIPPAARIALSQLWGTDLRLGDTDPSVEEPPVPRFHVGQRVSCGRRRGKIAHIDGKDIQVCWDPTAPHSCGELVWAQAEELHSA